MNRRATATLVLISAVIATNAFAQQGKVPGSSSIDDVTIPLITNTFGALGYDTSARAGKEFIFGQRLEEKNSAPDAGLILLKCNASIAWKIEGKDNDDGVIQVGICDRKSELSPALIGDAKEAQRRTISAIGQMTTGDTTTAFARYLPQIGKLEGRLPSNYMGVILVSHGVFILPTLLLDLPDGRRAVVLQLATSNCQFRPKSPLCSHEKELLQRVGLKIAKRLI